MTTSRRTAAASVIVAALSVVACSGSDPSEQAARTTASLPIGVDGDVNVIAALTPIVETFAPQQFDLAADEATRLVESVTTWCDDLRSGGSDAMTDAVLEQAEAVRQSWAAAAPFAFGPVSDRRSRLLVDFPISGSGVDETLASDQPVDSFSQRELGAADERGLGVVIHLVETAEAENDANRRCEYALGAADLVAEEVRAVDVAWATFGSGAVADDRAADDTLRSIVSEIAFSLSMIDPELEAPTTSRARLEGVDAIFAAEQQAGLAVLLDGVTVERLVDALDRAIADPTAENSMAVEVIIRTDVVSDLGLSLNFSDADGDG